MSVVYTKGPSNQGSNKGSSNNNRGSNRNKSYSQVTADIRTNAGVISSLVICVFTYFAFQFVAVILIGAGTVGTVALLIIAAGSLITSTVMIFRALKDRSIRVIYAPIVLFVASFIYPGLPILIAVVCTGISVVYVIGLIVWRIGHSRFFAVAIAAIPLVGSIFYVPSVLSNAGLVTHFSTAQMVTSPVAPQLISINQQIGRIYPNSAVLSYEIRKNRLYAVIADQNGTQSVELDTSAVVKTPLPWLEKNLSRQISVYLGPGSKGPDSPNYSQFAQILNPIQAKLGSYETILIAGSTLANFPHQAVLDGKQVFRSATLDSNQIAKNISQWSQSTILKPESVQIVNALPQSENEFNLLGMTNQKWNAWNTLHSKFNKAIPKKVSKQSISSSPTKAAILEALKSKSCVLLVIAHCDGFSIRLPSGETLHINDLATIKDALAANHPKVFLFSCETARLNNVQSFAKSLLDHGAQAVVAPVTQISASEALDVFKSFLSHALGDNSLPVNAAFQKALSETQRKLMEVWIAEIITEPAKS